MLNYKVIAQEGFTPAACGSPDAILPNRCCVILDQSRAVWGTGSCSLLHRTAS